MKNVFVLKKLKYLLRQSVLLLQSREDLRASNHGVSYTSSASLKNSRQRVAVDMAYS